MLITEYFLSISFSCTAILQPFTDTNTQQQLDDINQRYNDLLVGLQHRTDDLELTKQYIEKDNNVVNEYDWARDMEGKLMSAKPQSEDLEDLERDVMELQVKRNGKIIFSWAPWACLQIGTAVVCL